MEDDIGEDVVAEIGGDTAIPSSSFGPRPRRSAAFPNDCPSSSSDHPARAARAPRGGHSRGRGGTQTDEIAALHRQVSNLELTQDSLVTQVAGIYARTLEMHRMMQEMYYHQHHHHFDPSTPWPPPAPVE